MSEKTPFLQHSLKGHFCSKIDFFLFFILCVGIFLRPPMFLVSSISTSNLPKSLKMSLQRYNRNCILVLAKSYIGIGEISYWYGPNHISELLESYSGIGQIINLYWPNHITVLAKSYSGFSWAEWFFFQVSLKIPHRFTKWDEDPILGTKSKVPLTDILGISARRPGDLLQIDYQKWNFTMTQSVCWLVCWSSGLCHRVH